MTADAVPVLPPEIVAAAGRGWHILPVQARGKQPTMTGWPEAATSDITQLEAWAHQYPACNWGLATGTASGLVVIDIDGAEGRASLADLERQGLTLPVTLTVTTGRTDGGEHRYYRPPSGVDIRNDQSGKIGAHIDVRGTGGFVVCPPSIHASGKQYRFLDPDAPVADLPSWVIERLTVRPPTPIATAQANPQAVGKGSRTNTLVSLAGTMQRRVMSLEAIEAALLVENAAKCNPPLPEAKVKSIAADIVKRYPAGELNMPLPDEWPEPEPLAETLPDVAQFDLELMPESFRPLVKDVAERMQVPLDFPAVAAIATLAGVTNRRAVIQPKRNDDTWTVVPNLWGGIVASPGMLKSPIINCMTQPARAIESEWRKVHEDEEQTYGAALESQKLEIAAWEQEYKKAAKKRDSKERPAKPEFSLVQPVLRRLVTSDATFESLHVLLSENPAGLFVLRDELTGWLAGLERQGREQERAFFLECWNGDAAHTIDRIGRGSVFVPHACVSLFGGIQPGRLRPYLADALRDGPSDDGLMQRFQLLVWPDKPPASQYIDRKPDADALERTAEVYRRIAALDAENPLRLKFDNEAQALFQQWLTDLVKRIREDDLTPAMQAHLAKYRSLMPSLALLFALADGHTDCVPLSQTKLACDWCEYLETHANRMYSAQARPEQQAAIALSKRLAKGWKREDGAFTVRDVYHNHWSKLNYPDEARGALLVLEEYGWVRRETDAQTTGRPSEIYRINPRIGGTHACK
jgi:hypothetical protein